MSSTIHVASNIEISNNSANFVLDNLSVTREILGADSVIAYPTSRSSPFLPSLGRI